MFHALDFGDTLVQSIYFALQVVFDLVEDLGLASVLRRISQAQLFQLRFVCFVLLLGSVQFVLLLFDLCFLLLYEFYT